MITNRESKFPYFLVGIGLGAVAGLLFAPRAGDETRRYLREQSTKSLDALNRKAEKLRESSEGIVQKGREFMNRRYCASVTTDTEAEKKIAAEQRPETAGL
jgi:gas vesicle protein